MTLGNYGDPFALSKLTINDRINLAQKQGPVLNTPARLAKALNKYNLTSRVSHGRLNMASSTIELDSVHVDVEVCIMYKDCRFVCTFC